MRGEQYDRMRLAKVRPPQFASSKKKSLLLYVDVNITPTKTGRIGIYEGDDLKDTAILVFANKADLPSARDAAEITDLYSLHEVKNHDWKIQACCALTGQGLEEGLDWLTAKLQEKVASK